MKLHFYGIKSHSLGRHLDAIRRAHCYYTLLYFLQHSTYPKNLFHLGRFNLFQTQFITFTSPPLNPKVPLSILLSKLK